MDRFSDVNKNYLCYVNITYGMLNRKPCENGYQTRTRVSHSHTRLSFCLHFFFFKLRNRSGPSPSQQWWNLSHQPANCFSFFSPSLHMHLSVWNVHLVYVSLASRLTRFHTLSSLVCLIASGVTFPSLSLESHGQLRVMWLQRSWGGSRIEV